MVEEISAIKLTYLKFLYGFNFIRASCFATFSPVLRNSGSSQHGKLLVNADSSLMCQGSIVSPG